MKKDHNLNNPDANPENTSIDVQCRVHFTMIEAIPKLKLARWLDSLPVEARVKFEGISSGKAGFVATWTESRERAE